MASSAAAFRALAWAAVRLWALPWTLVGICAGLAALAGGGTVRVRAGVIEFHGRAITWLFERLPIGPSAMTFGHTVLGRTAAALDLARDHERVHVRQYERWGPLFVPAYLMMSLVARLRGRNAYRDNPFEREAFAAGGKDSCDRGPEAS